MKTLSYQLKPLFVEAVTAAFPELASAEVLKMVGLEAPREVAHGDYACPVAFQLSKKLGKSPVAIGEAIVAHFPDDFRVGEVSFAAPGFVNLRLSPAFLAEELKTLEQGFSVEHEEGVRRRPVIVEYTSTNAAKVVGSHHAMTTFIGDALANLFEFMGYEVIRLNHLGDWGTNFGMLIYAVETWGDQEVIRRDPLEELTKLYVRFNEEAEANPDLKEKAREVFKALEEGDAERTELWEWIVAESIRDIDALFARLGVQVRHMGERFYLEMAEEILKDGIERGLFVPGEGGESLIFDMGENQVPALLRKSDGTTLYLTRDLATAKYRIETWHPEAVLYVVDHAQSLHFQQDFAIVEALGYPAEAAKAGTPVSLEHISFGRMSFADSGMSTRKGNIIKMKRLLDEAARRSGEIAAERGSELPREELAALMESMGIASVKYGLLAQDRNKDVIFDWDKIISLEGNSAPYLLYSYARAHSIAEKLPEVALAGLPKLGHEAEVSLLRHMVKFPEVLQRALDERKPHMIAMHLFELCQSFNRFYGAVSVAKAETADAQRTRLGLVHAFMHQLKAGLGILGIPVVERM